MLLSLIILRQLSGQTSKKSGPREGVSNLANSPLIMYVYVFSLASH